jgi:ankyrin repeat protein
MLATPVTIRLLAIAMYLPRLIESRMLSALLAAGLLTQMTSAAEESGSPQVTPILEPAPKSAGSALLTAALGRDWEKVSQALAAGADPKVTDENGLTPLMAAAIAGHVPTIEALIAAGAPPETVDARVRTALGYAIALKQSAAVEALLAHQPVLPAAALGGDDLASAALDAGDPQLFDTILRRLPGGLTWTPAARIGFAKALAARDTLLGPLFLAKYAGRPAPSDNAQPLLAYAVTRGDLEQVRTLLDFGADPDTVLDQPGDAAFREWISSNYVKYYLDSTSGITVLMLAAGMKKTECVNLLLERGANRLASTRGKARLIALYFAAWSDDPETLQALIKNAPSKDELRIEVSLDEQRARFYRDGQLVLTTTISTGRAGFPTRPGEYVITDKNRHHRSSIYHDASMPYFMRLSCRDFGLHQGVVTGRPASHGCIRLHGDVAARLFKEVPVGTWVSIRRDSKETAAASPEPRKR